MSQESVLRSPQKNPERVGDEIIPLSVHPDSNRERNLHYESVSISALFGWMTFSLSPEWREEETEISLRRWFDDTRRVSLYVLKGAKSDTALFLVMSLFLLMSAYDRNMCRIFHLPCLSFFLHLLVSIKTPPRPTREKAWRFEERSLSVSDGRRGRKKTISFPSFLSVGGDHLSFFLSISIHPFRVKIFRTDDFEGKRETESKNLKSSFHFRIQIHRVLSSSFRFVVLFLVGILSHSPIAEYVPVPVIRIVCCMRRADGVSSKKPRD